MEEKLQEVAVLNAEKFFTRRGYEIIEKNYESPAGGVGIIAKDGITLVFVSVDYCSDGEGFHDIDKAAARPRAERTAAYYLTNDAPDELLDCPIRYDDFQIQHVRDKVFFVRHHVNSLSLD